MESLDGSDRQPPFAQRPLMIEHRAEIARVKPVFKEVKVKEMVVNRDIRLVYPAKRALSHAAQAFLEVVGVPTQSASQSSPRSS